MIWMMFNFLVILSLTSALCVTINNYIFPLYQPDLVILVAYQEKGFFRKSIMLFQYLVTRGYKQIMGKKYVQERISTHATSSCKYTVRQIWL